MVVSKIRGPPIWTPKYCNPYYGDPQKGSPNFGKPPYNLPLLTMGCRHGTWTFKLFRMPKEESGGLRFRV